MKIAPDTHPVPLWLRRTLAIAGVYNLLWGAWVILLPASLFTIMDLPQPTYPAIWQCVGMIVGVYGVGYLIAARDPIRHWPIVLVGLQGKVLGPIGFVYASLIMHELPARFFWVNIPNDIIWWVPFTMLLWISAKHHQSATHDKESQRMSIDAALKEHGTQAGVSLSDLAQSRPVMLVFLRHLGCTFCLETLQDLQRQRAKIEAQGILPVLVHMSDDAAARKRFAQYNLEDLPSVSDPDQDLYRAFELRRGSFLQLFGPRVWFQGLRAIFKGNTVGKLAGDGFQMPGIFIIHKGQIIQEFKHATAGDRPGYESMACACEFSPS